MTGIVASDVVVWFTVPLFVQSAVLPCFTDACFGMNMKLTAEMLTVAASATDWVRATSNSPRGTARRTRRNMGRSFRWDPVTHNLTGELCGGIGAAGRSGSIPRVRPPADL